MKKSSSYFNTQISESAGVWLTPALSNKEDDSLAPLPTDDDLLFQIESKDRALVAQASKLPGELDAVQLYILKYCLPVVDITCGSEADAKKIAKEYVKEYEDRKKNLADKAIDKNILKESVQPANSKVIYESFDFENPDAYTPQAPSCAADLSPSELTTAFLALLDTEILAEKPGSPIFTLLNSIKSLMLEVNDIRSGVNIDSGLATLEKPEELASANDFAY